MIVSVRLQNFQNHDDSLFEFVDGVNAIVGESDNGKSALTKAIDWIANDNPSGDEFIKDGTKEATVTIVKCDGDIIYTIIKRRAKKTSYELIKESYEDPQPYSQKFEACGRAIPDEIVKVMNFNASNIQTQFHPFFLLNDKASAVAKELQEVAGLSKISAYTKTINAQGRSVSSDIKAQELIVTTNTDHLRGCFSRKKLSELSEMNDDLVGSIKRVQTLSDKCSSIDKLITKHAELSSRKTELKQGIAKLREVEELYTEYISLTDEAFDITKKVALINGMRTVTNLPSEERVSSLIKEAAKLEGSKKTIVAITKSIEAYRVAKKVMGKSNKQIKKLTKDHKDLLASEGSCPICGSEL